MVLEEMNQLNRRFLIVLAQEHLNFRISELESLLFLNGLNLKLNWENNTDTKSPFIVLNNVTELQVKNILKRTVLAKNGYEIWGEGKNYDELKSSLLNYPKIDKDPYFSKDKSFCIRIKGFGRKISLKEQVVKIDSLEDVIPFQGPVNLKEPSDEYHIIEDYGYNDCGHPPKSPKYIYFGRWVASGQRQLSDQFSIKRRKFIGNTSMDAVLSFVMSNHACVRTGSVVCDPFVGTGSLLVSAAHFGGYVCGGDINYTIVHGRGKTSRAGGGWRGKEESIR